MPYRQNNYSFVIDSSFRPYTQEEMLRPLLMYKDAYEKAEENFNALGEAGKYDYLAGIDPEDEAAKIYNNYANAYNSAFEDFKNYGVRGSRRSLLDLKRRYKSDIGRLDAADKALQEELKIRREKNDPSMLYAENNLKLSSFLDNKRPNLYSISAEDLRKEGMIYGQASSSRIYSNSRIENINKYFQDIVREQGIRPDILNAWRAQLISIPEFDRAVNDILKARRVDENLTGADYETARQSVINGIMEGSIYKEARNTERNPDVPDWAQRDASNRAWANYNMQRALNGLIPDKNSPNGLSYSRDADIKLQRNAAILEEKSKYNGNKNSSRSGKSPSTSKVTQMKNGIRATWSGNDPGEKGYDGKVVSENIASDDTTHIGTYYSYDELLKYPYAKEFVDKHIKDGRTDMYDYYFQPYEHGILNDTEAQIEIIPRPISTDNNSSVILDLGSGGSDDYSSYEDSDSGLPFGLS